MRVLTTLLLLLTLGLGGFVGAQDDPTPPPPQDDPPAEKKDDAEWKIKKPESQPVGEPVTLKLALEPGSGHMLDTNFSQTMETPMGPMTNEMGMKVIMKILATDEKGESTFEMPIEFTKMMFNGQDMVQMIKMSAPNPKLMGKLDGKGAVIPGSTKFDGMGGMEAQMGSRFENIMPALPEKPLRVGEVTELTAKEYMKALGESFDGGEVNGEVYQVLEKIEKEVAHLKTVFSLHMHGDDIEVQPGMKGQGDIRMMGETTTLFGLDGYLRSSASTMKTKMDIPSLGMPPMTMEIVMKMTGGKVANDAPKEEAEPKGEEKKVGEAGG